MELKVWVEGIQRIVCGVTEATTCQDVVYALAHATGKTGRFTLVEKWRNNERLLPPHEHPLKVLSKWGEYASDVQLVLRRSNIGAKANQEAQNNVQGTGFTSPPAQQGFRQHQKLLKGNSPPRAGGGESNSTPIKKSLTFSGGSGSSGSAVSDNQHHYFYHRHQQQQYHHQPESTLPSTPFRDSAKEQRDWSEVPHGVVKGIPHLVQGSDTSGAIPAAKDMSPPKLNGRIIHNAYSHHQYPQGRQQQEESSALIGAGGRLSKIPEPQFVSSGRITGGHRISENGPGPPQGPRILRPPEPIRQNGVATATRTQMPRTVIEQNGDVKANNSHPASQEPTVHTSSKCSGGGGNATTKLLTSGSAPSMIPVRRSGVPVTAQELAGSAQQQHHYISSTPSSTSSSGRGSCHSSPMSPTSGIPVTVCAKDGTSMQCSEQHGSGGGGSSGFKTTAPSRVPQLQQQQNPVPVHMGTPKSRRNLLSEFKRHDLEEELREDSFLGRGNQERVVYDARYKDLVRLINLQREKLSRQQADLTQFDAEISYWEEKQKDHQRQIEIIEREIQKHEVSGRDSEDEILQFDKLHLEDEFEIGKQQEKMLQSELTLLRSKLANCETELLQCKNKIRLLMDEISEDQRWISKEEEERKQKEMEIYDEIEDLQKDIQDTLKAYESKTKQVDSFENLDHEVKRLESAIADKKKQVEGLVQEMKEANLESLALTPSEEIRHLLEGGSHKGPGSSRKIVGSPRQLENAVPTSKNPHGVWV